MLVAPVASSEAALAAPKSTSAVATSAKAAAAKKAKAAAAKKAKAASAKKAKAAAAKKAKAASAKKAKAAAAKKAKAAAAKKAKAAAAKKAKAAAAKKAAANKARANSRLAESIAGKYNVKVKYAERSACGPFARANQRGVLGCYQPSTPNTIYLPTWMKQYKASSGTSFNQQRTSKAARHETAHALIHRTCGTAIPKIAGKRIENITDAYARLYLGSSKSMAHVPVTATDLAKAKSIRKGTCK